MEPEEAGERHLIVFRVAEADCALPVEVARDVLPMASLAYLPGQPAIVEGFLNLRGRAVPVVSARRLFDRPLSEPGMFSHVIVAGRGDSLLGMIVDRVEDLATVASGDLRPVSDSSSFNGCAEAHFTLDGRTVAFLSLDRLLLVEERQRLAEFQELAQRRLEQLEPERT